MGKEFTNMAKQVIKAAAREALDLSHGYIGTEHLLLALLDTSGCVAAKVLENSDITRERIYRLIEDLVTPKEGVIVADREEFTPKARQVLERAGQQAERLGYKETGTEHLLLAMITEPDCMACRLLHTAGLNAQKMCVDLLAAMGQDASRIKESFQNGKPVVQRDEGTTPTLEKYSRDLTKAAKLGRLDPVVGREDEINRLVQILSRRTKNNPCLTGEPGVGKTAIILQKGVF